MKTVTAQEIKKMQDAGEEFLLVNTLPAEKFGETKIPGAVSIPQEDVDFSQRVEQQAGGKDRPVVVYCASQQCDSSTQGANKLTAAGFTDIYEFEAGWEGWRQAFPEKAAAGKAKKETPAKR